MRLLRRRAEERSEWLVVGLGNPGSRYADSRHNVGFWCVNRLARRHGIVLKSSGVAAVGVGRVGSARVALAKPRTFMNESGRALGPLARRFGVTPERLLVVCDDLDLPLGVVRLRASGGHAGHRGVASVVEALGTADFPRLRIGIGRPLVGGEPSYDPDVVADYVLASAAPEERAALDGAVERAVAAIETLAAEGLEVAMQQFNR